MSLRANRFLKILKIILIVGSVLAALKVIFVDYTLDEEYQVVMAYRNLTGDALFGAMWEPHQTSAFVCAWLMRLYIAISGTTTGVVVFLRVCTVLVQCALSLWLGRAMGHMLQKDYAFLLGLCYFNIVPKIIQIPDFSNLQVWFYTVIVLALLEYYEARRLRWMIIAGLGMAMEVLAYPAGLILFPFFLVCIFLSSRGRAGKSKGTARLETEEKTKHFSKSELSDETDGDGIEAEREIGNLGNTGTAVRDCAIFAGVCGICAALWLCRVLSGVTLEEFLRNIRYVLDFDLTHDMSLTAEFRIIALLRDFKTLVILMAVICGLAFVMWQFAGKLYGRGEAGEHFNKKILCSPTFAVCLVLAAEIVQLYYWLIPRKGYEEPQIHLLVVFLAAALVWRSAGWRKKRLMAGILGGALTILAVIYMSDLGIWYALPHGLLGTLFGMAVLILALEEQLGGEGRVWAYLLLFSMAFVSVFGKGFTLRAGKTPTNTVLGVGGIIRKGPSAGIFTNYMQAYITNSTYDEFQTYVKPGSKCLIVTNMVGTAGTSPYMFTGAQVCHFSIVDPTSYDERLLTYWALYPEKRPEVIVVDCWYGELKESEESWIMRYIENDFGYTRAVDGKYVRYYLKNSGDDV